MLRRVEKSADAARRRRRPHRDFGPLLLCMLLYVLPLRMRPRMETSEVKGHFCRSGRETSEERKQIRTVSALACRVGACRWHSRCSSTLSPCVSATRVHVSCSLRIDLIDVVSLNGLLRRAVPEPDRLVVSHHSILLLRQEAGLRLGHTTLLLESALDLEGRDARQHAAAAAAAAAVSRGGGGRVGASAHCSSRSCAVCDLLSHGG